MYITGFIKVLKPVDVMVYGEFKRDLMGTLKDIATYDFITSRAGKKYKNYRYRIDDDGLEFKDYFDKDTYLVKIMPIKIGIYVEPSRNYDFNEVYGILDDLVYYWSQRKKLKLDFAADAHKTPNDYDE